MVDMTDSKSVAGDCVRVQVSSPVSQIPCQSGEGFFLPAAPRFSYPQKPGMSTNKKNARRRRAVGGNTHFAPAAIAANVNSYKGQIVCSDDI